MEILVLLFVGGIIWFLVSGKSASPTYEKHQQQNKSDKEFEDMNLALKDTDDDFGIF